MAVKIRLRRVGAKKRPFYRLVVADARSPRDGRFIEAIGTYDPLQNPALVKVDADRVKEWISKGAKPTDIARQLLVAEGVLEHTGPKFERVEKSPKLSKKQVAKARAAETAAAEPPPPEAPAAAIDATATESGSEPEAPALAEAEAPAEVETPTEAEAPAEAGAAAPAGTETVAAEQATEEAASADVEEGASDAAASETAVDGTVPKTDTEPVAETAEEEAK